MSLREKLGAFGLLIGIFVFLVRILGGTSLVWVDEARGAGLSAGKLETSRYGGRLEHFLMLKVVLTGRSEVLHRCDIAQMH